MNKQITLEIDQQCETIELHINIEGAEYLKKIIDKLISINKDEHLHLMTPEWGGDELSSDKQNQSDNYKLIHHLKIMYWKEDE